jgi:hypothetical protein
MSFALGWLFAFISALRGETFDALEIVGILLISGIGTVVLLWLEKTLRRRRVVFTTYILLTLYFLSIFLELIVSLPFTPDIFVQYQVGISAMLASTTLTLLLKILEK